LLCVPHPSDGLEGRLQKFLQGAEDTIHLVVAVLLLILGSILLVGVVNDLVDALKGPYHEAAIVLSTLDNGLVLSSWPSFCTRSASPSGTGHWTPNPSSSWV
jgi:hypothetical protein